MTARTAAPLPPACGWRPPAAGGGDGLEIHDFAFADLADSRIHPSPVFGDAFSRSNAAAGFVDDFDRAYQTRISGLSGAPAALRGDPAQVMRENAGMRTRTLRAVSSRAKHAAACPRNLAGGRGAEIFRRP